MPSHFKNAKAVAHSIKRDCLTPGYGAILWQIKSATAVEPERAPHDVQRFDMLLHDGRVYRVRVSDITPERETT